MHQISETIAISLMLPMHQISYCSDFFSIAGKQSLPIIKTWRNTNTLNGNGTNFSILECFNETSTEGDIDGGYGKHIVLN